MSEPLDSAVILEDVLSVVQQQYMPKYVEQYTRFGQMTNRLIQFDSRLAGGDGITLQTEVAPADTVRWSNDALAPLAAPDFFEPTTIKARWNDQDSTANDFSRPSGAAQIADTTIQNASRGTIVNIADRIYAQVMPDYEEKLAVMRHLPRTSNYLGLVNGTPKQHDNTVFNSCTATPTNTTGLAVPIDTGSIAYFKRGLRVDFYSSAGVLHAGNVRIAWTNPADPAGPCIHVDFTTAAAGIPTSRVSTGNLASVADNDEIYISGQRNQGFYSIGAYMQRPAATGDSFIGATNRMTAINRYLLPTVAREGSTAAKITKTMFNDLGIAMGFRDEGGMVPVFLMDPTIHQAVRDELGEQSFIQLPTDDSRAKRFGHFGQIGLIYQHPTFGVVQIAADPLVPSNTIRFIQPADWSTLFYGFKGLQPIKENGSHWYRMNEAAPNTGRGLIWKCDWYCPGQMDWCMRPWAQGAILNVTAA